MAEPIHHPIKFEKSAHYYTLGEFTGNTEYIWLVCHGYGQAADRFINKFDILDTEKHFVIAPEGLSRFYWGGFTGEVVASWMTSKDRLDEIEDYVQFLDMIMDVAVPPTFGGQIIMLGFSQGVATLMRYLDRHRPSIEKVILWAGVFPPDINYSEFYEYLNTMELHYFYGDQDEFITKERFDREQETIRSEKIRVQLHPFLGPHKIMKEVLLRFVETWHS